MPKTKKYSISYWIKTIRNRDPLDALADAVILYAEQGNHPEIDFDEPPLALANALYLEWAKKARTAGGLYCTPPDLARRLAKSLDLSPGQVCLDPGLGLGSLSLAAREVTPGARTIGIEDQAWLGRIAEAVGLPNLAGDFLDGLTLPEFDAVIVNPPFGKAQGYSKIEAEFLARIVNLARPGVKVAALLPGTPGHFWQHLPKKYADLPERLLVLETEDLGRELFKPFAAGAVSRYLLEITAGPAA